MDRSLLNPSPTDRSSTAVKRRGTALPQEGHVQIPSGDVPLRRRFFMREIRARHQPASRRAAGGQWTRGNPPTHAAAVSAARLAPLGAPRTASRIARRIPRTLEGQRAAGGRGAGFCCAPRGTTFSHDFGYPEPRELSRRWVGPIPAQRALRNLPPWPRQLAQGPTEHRQEKPAAVLRRKRHLATVRAGSGPRP